MTLESLVFVIFEFCWEMSKFESTCRSSGPPCTRGRDMSFFTLLSFFLPFWLSFRFGQFCHFYLLSLLTLLSCVDPCLVSPHFHYCLKNLTSSRFAAPVTMNYNLLLKHSDKGAFSWGSRKFAKLFSAFEITVLARQLSINPCEGTCSEFAVSLLYALFRWVISLISYQSNNLKFEIWKDQVIN